MDSLKRLEDSQAEAATTAAEVTTRTRSNPKSNDSNIAIIYTGLRRFQEYVPSTDCCKNVSASLSDVMDGLQHHNLDDQCDVDIKGVRSVVDQCVVAAAAAVVCSSSTTTLRSNDKRKHQSSTGPESNQISPSPKKRMKTACGRDDSTSAVRCFVSSFSSRLHRKRASYDHLHRTSRQQQQCRNSASSSKTDGDDDDDEDNEDSLLDEHKAPAFSRSDNDDNGDDDHKDDSDEDNNGVIYNLLIY